MASSSIAPLETFTFAKSFPDFDKNIQACIRNACLFLSETGNNNTLVALEIHMQPPRNILALLDRNKLKLENEVLKMKNGLAKQHKMMSSHSYDSMEYLTMEIKDIPARKLAIQNAEINLQNFMGFHSKYYAKQEDDDHYHIFYLVQTNSSGKPMLLAIANKDNNLKWKNIDLKTDLQVFIDDTLPTTISSDKFNLTFNIRSQDPAGRPVFGITNLLPILSISCPLIGLHDDPIFYNRDPMIPLMGSDEAKRKIVEYKLKNVNDRLDHLNLCIEKLNETEKIPEYESLKLKQDELQENLNTLDEPKNLEDLTPCIRSVVRFLINNSYQGLVAIQIQCPVPSAYLENILMVDHRRIQDRLSSSSSPRHHILPQEIASRKLDLDTFNGYRLDKENQPKSIFYTLLIQVVDGKIIILAKMIKDYASSQKLVSHTWKNFEIPHIPSQSKKVLENVNSMVLFRDLHDYIFSIGNDADICNDPEAFIGRTSALPQLFYLKNTNHTFSPIESKNKHSFKAKSCLTEDSFLHETYKLELATLAAAINFYILPEETLQKARTQARHKYIESQLSLLKEKLKSEASVGSKRPMTSPSSSSSIAKKVAETLQMFQSLDLRQL